MSEITQHGPAPAQVTTPGDRDIRVERVFDASPGRVWEAMTTPELIAQWWGRGNELVVERYELERGGHWRFVERSGGAEHGFEGRFGDIVPAERIVQTFEWDGMPAHPSRETMTLDDLGDGRTRMVTGVVFFTPEERDGMMQAGMEAGMNESYAALDRLLARMD
jgi:uncharacterized protein YndB with AHSA1/START domain